MLDVSRRSFVELLVGSLVSLPALAGGLLVAPAPAFAEDTTTDDGQDETPNYVIIDVVRP